MLDSFHLPDLLNPTQLLPDHLTPQSFLILPVLVALEAVLSADNAIALAAITQGLRDPKLEEKEKKRERKENDRTITHIHPRQES